MIGYDTGFHEVAHEVWTARYEWHDVNITLVRGERGLLMVDTHSSTASARAVIADIERAGLGRVAAVVNTHEHFDHTFGNSAVRARFGDVPIYATSAAAGRTLASAADFKARFDEELRAGSADPRVAEVLATDVTVADHVFEDRTTVDLGGRHVNLIHPGRGHTGGDLVAVVPGANVVVAGDLLEQSGPPVYLDQCFPLDWPATLQSMMVHLDAESVVIPGHGHPVGREFALRQHEEVSVVARTIEDLARRKVPASQAASVGKWPWPTDSWRFAAAIPRGYEQLGLPAAG